MVDTCNYLISYAIYIITTQERSFLLKNFEELYNAYYRDIFRFLYKLSGYNESLAEELTQETYYHVYISIAGFKENCNIKTWLFQIAKNRYFLGLRNF